MATLQRDRLCSKAGDKCVKKIQFRVLARKRTMKQIVLPT